MRTIGIGELAALVTALSWAGSNQVHTMAGRIIGGMNVTAARVPLYVAGTGLVAVLSGAEPGMPAGAFPYLVFSALMGIALCDPLTYTAAVAIGPRLAVLILSLSACITAILGYLFLGESINLMGWLGIITASSGVAFVLMEGGLKAGGDTEKLTRPQFLRGILLAFLGAVSLAISFLTLKKALLFGLNPIWAVFIRMCMGGGFLWLMMAVRRKLVPVLREAWTNWRILRLLLIGCLVATTGNCLSAVAMHRVETGIAATLIGLQPIMIIFVIMAVERKLPSIRAVIGTVIAFTGTAMIFMR